MEDEIERQLLIDTDSDCGTDESESGEGGRKGFRTRS
jgi:hypothetical protein